MCNRRDGHMLDRPNRQRRLAEKMADQAMARIARTVRIGIRCGRPLTLVRARIGSGGSGKTWSRVRRAVMMQRGNGHR